MDNFIPLEQKTWKPFVVEDLFNIKIGKPVIGNTVDKNSGKYPYVTRKETNNGIDGFIDYDEEYLNKEFPVITIGAETAKPFVQNFPFFTGVKVNIMSPKKKLSRYTLLFIAQVLEKQKSNYSYAFAMISSRLRKVKIQLPVNELGEPDFEYMEAYIKNIFAEKLQRYLEFRH